MSEKYYDSLRLELENKVLAQLFLDYAKSGDGCLPDYWQIQYDEQKNPIGVIYDEEECAPAPDYASPDGVTQFLIWVMFEYHDSGLRELIKKNRDEIDRNYQKIHSYYFEQVLRGTTGLGEYAIDDAVEKWGLKAVDPNSPEFQDECEKWALIAEYELYPVLTPDTIYENIPGAVEEGDPYLLLCKRSSNRLFTNVDSFQTEEILYTPETGWKETFGPQPDRNCERYRKYKQLEQQLSESKKD